MKKVILSVVAVLLITIIGIVIFKQVVQKKEDVSISSVDGEVVLSFEKITRENTWRVGDSQLSFALADDIDFYTDYVKENESFVGFIDEHNNMVDERTNRYLFCKEKHYFYAICEGENVTIYEMVGGFYTGENAYFVILPYSGGLAFSEVNSIDYSELIGVNSYEDLVAFYEKTNEQRYEIDEANNCIYLSMYSYGEIIENGVKVTVSNQGIEIILLEEYR